jgi:hypothetical protein
MASKYFSHSVQNVQNTQINILSKIPTSKDAVNNRRRSSINKKALISNPNKENDITTKTIKMKKDENENKDEVAVVTPQKAVVKIEDEPKDHNKDIGIDVKIKKDEKKDEVSVVTPQKTIINIEDEPLLKPNPRRFVLFPIQFHEVCISEVLKHEILSFVTLIIYHIYTRYGECIKKPKHHFGQLRKWIFPRI